MPESPGKTTCRSRAPACVQPIAGENGLLYIRAERVGDERIPAVGLRPHSPARVCGRVAAINRDAGIGCSGSATKYLLAAGAHQQGVGKTCKSALRGDDFVALQATWLTLRAGWANGAGFARWTLLALWALLTLRAGWASGAGFTLWAWFALRTLLALRAGRASGAGFTLWAWFALRTLLALRALWANGAGFTLWAGGAGFTLRTLLTLRTGGAGFTLGTWFALRTLLTLRAGRASGTGFTLRTWLALRALRANGAGFALRTGRPLEILFQIEFSVAVCVDLQNGVFEREDGGAAGLTGGALLAGRTGRAFWPAWAGFARVSLAATE